MTLTKSVKATVNKTSIYLPQPATLLESSNLTEQEMYFRFCLDDGMEILDLATRLNRLPNEVVIFGIQPASVEPGERLTAALQNKMGEYQTAILQEVGSA
ncbi:MAG: hypothetical protein HQ519_09030 [Planctomycetes bacterium]|nr:hypothetical protein [Planctomycetota bacterium]